MKVKYLLILTLMVGAGIAGVTWFERMVDRSLNLMDFNSDGLLQPTEIGPLARHRFDVLDADASGYLDKSEQRLWLLSNIGGKVSAALNQVSPSFDATSASTSNDDIRLMLQRMVNDLNLPGAALIFGRDGGEVVQLSVGDISIDSVVPVASASKWITAATVMVLVDQGVLQLDQPIESYIDSLPPRWSRVTIRQLLSHTAGVERSHVLNVSPQSVRASMYKAVIGVPFHADSGSEFAYGGATMQMAGLVAEAVTGESWGDIFDTLVAKPIGMQHSFYGHPLWDGERSEIITPNLGGGLHTSAREYFAFLARLAGADDDRFISNESIASMEIDNSSGLNQYFRPTGIPDSWGYGLGLWCESIDNVICDRVSSAGAFGTYPWIDRKTGTFGVLVTLGEAIDVMPYAQHISQMGGNYLPRASNR